MIALTQLRNAQSAIEEAKRKLRRLKSHEDADVGRLARRAISELEDAESEIERALRALPRN
jgi:hypothetical protein